MREALIDVMTMLKSMETSSEFRRDEVGRYLLEWDCGAIHSTLSISSKPYLTAYKKGKKIHSHRFESPEDLQENHPSHMLKTLERKK